MVSLSVGHSRPFWLLLGLYLVFALAYGSVNPLLESPDERLNYENMREIAETGQLPVLSEGELSKAHHPPLYYLIGRL